MKYEFGEKVCKTIANVTKPIEMITSEKDFAKEIR